MNNKMIFHYGNLAGIPYCFALSLRKIGINSISIKPIQEEAIGGYPDNVVLERMLPTDEVLFERLESKGKKILKSINFMKRIINNSSLIHFYGATFWKEYGPAFIKLFNKPMIISWGGGDARIISEARRNNPYFYREPNEEHDSKIRKKLEWLSKHIQYVATDVELAEYSKPYFKKIFIIKQPVDLSECICRAPEIKNISPVILHIPTHAEVKGTKHVEAAIERMRTEGLSFQFVRMQPNLSQKEVKVELAKADIYVDELRCGSYGMMAVEAMASGKPVLTYIREDIVDKYPKDIPIVNANPDTIYTKLREMVIDSERRHEVGIKGRAYTEKYHSLEVVGPAMLNIYKEIGLKA